MSQSPQNNSARKPIRSYVLREGRLTKGQARALEELWPQYGLSPTKFVAIDFDRVFKRQAPVTLEIGFGDGGALLETAHCHSDRNYVGIEVHRPGVGSLLLRLKKEGVSNVRVICGDATEVLKNSFKDVSLDRLHLFFPDPWHKKKHHKRRILSSGFIELVADKLKQGGVFHFATDWQDYAEQGLQRLEHCSRLINLAGAGQYSRRPESRPETKFERRGQRLGHEVWDVLMAKQ
jgi:tRNA (guanine-N7-)-methyltransferase